MICTASLKLLIIKSDNKERVEWIGYQCTGDDFPISWRLGLFLFAIKFMGDGLQRQVID